MREDIRQRLDYLPISSPFIVGGPVVQGGSAPMYLSPSDNTRLQDPLKDLPAKCIDNSSKNALRV